MWMVLPSTNHSARTPRECGPEQSKCEISFGRSGVPTSNRSTPAGVMPTVLAWYATASVSPTRSSELERSFMCAVRSADDQPRVARIATSTLEKFLGADFRAPAT